MNCDCAKGGNSLRSSRAATSARVKKNKNEIKSLVFKLMQQYEESDIHRVRLSRLLHQHPGRACVCVCVFAASPPPLIITLRKPPFHPVPPNPDSGRGQFPLRPVRSEITGTQSHVAEESATPVFFSVCGGEAAVGLEVGLISWSRSVRWPWD